jgi:hypothetical protein
LNEVCFSRATTKMCAVDGTGGWVLGTTGLEGSESGTSTIGKLRLDRGNSTQE